MNILDTLTKSQLEKVEIKDIEKDITLFRENDVCNKIGIVLQGQVSIVTYINNGKEIIFNTLNTNEIFGNNLIFSSKPIYKGNIITNVSTKLALINKNDLLSFLQNNETFLLEYLRLQSDFGKNLNNRIKLLSISSAEERFNFYMYENKNTIEISSITTLAKELSLERETLSRLLSKLEKEKKIIRKNKRIVLI